MHAKRAAVFQVVLSHASADVPCSCICRQGISMDTPKILVLLMFATAMVSWMLPELPGCVVDHRDWSGI